jgi:hypothetical protein
MYKDIAPTGAFGNLDHRFLQRFRLSEAIMEDSKKGKYTKILLFNFFQAIISHGVTNHPKGMLFAALTAKNLCKKYV